MARIGAMIGYAVYKQNLPEPVEVIRYDEPLDNQRLDTLVDHLKETHGPDIVVRLMSQAEFDDYFPIADALL
jgi:hypothetical protein